MSDYVVNIRQIHAPGRYCSLFLPQKQTGSWEVSIATAGVFGYKEAVKLANKMKDRFTVVNNLQPIPPAGLISIYIIEIDENNNILSELEVK